MVQLCWGWALPAPHVSSAIPAQAAPPRVSYLYASNSSSCYQKLWSKEREIRNAGGTWIVPTIVVLCPGFRPEEPGKPQVEDNGGKGAPGLSCRHQHLREHTRGVRRTHRLDPVGVYEFDVVVVDPGWRVRLPLVGDESSWRLEGTLNKGMSH